jgi:hypothetical protein
MLARVTHLVTVVGNSGTSATGQSNTEQ